MPENEKKKEKCKLQQFERNNYFYGKLMTVRDFELEQDYYNGKRHLLNRLIHGPGLLCGFSNLEIFTDSTEVLRIRFRDGGVALDAFGREIVVPVETEKKVIGKDGEVLKKTDLKEINYLYLRYSLCVSELVNAASSPLSCEEITCPNRVLEDFEVLASPEYPKENSNEKENGNGVPSCHECNEVGGKVFFAAVNSDLLINEEETGRRNFISIKHSETSKNNIATGTVSFIQPTVNRVLSDFIDPKLGTGPICVNLALEKEDENLLSGPVETCRESGVPAVHLGSLLDPVSGKFRVEVLFEDERERNSVRIRWWAFKPDIRFRTMEVKPAVTLARYKFASDPSVKAKIAENGLCESGGKNCMHAGEISGGDHYARAGNDIALNGNPEKRAELSKEQDDEPHHLYESWEVGGGWTLKVEKFDNTGKTPKALLRLYFTNKQVKEFQVSKGDLITYCEDIADEKAVPLFVSYVDDISVPIIRSMIGKEANVTLKYTWAVSKNVRTVK